MKTRWYVLVLGIAIMALLLGACSQTSAGSSTPTTKSAAAGAATPTPTPHQGGTMTVILGQGPVTSFGYPPLIQGQDDYSVYQTLEQIIDVDSKLNWKPKLATNVQVAPDAKSVTLTLRKDVKFHDGTSFNAQAAKWNLDNIIQAKFYGTDTWSSVDVVDDYTIRLNLKQVDYTVIYNLASPATLEISPTAFQNAGSTDKDRIAWANRHPVGTGPFKFVSFEQDVSLKTVKFADYWQKGQPYLDAFNYSYVKDPVTQQAALMNGEGQAIVQPDPKAVFDLQAKGFVPAGSAPTFMYSIGPDSINPSSILANIKVRQALEYAMDRNAIAKAVGYGFFSGVNQPCPAGYPGYNADITGRLYDPAKAKQLLTEAGYTSGFKTMLFADASQVNQDILVAIQGYWKAVGVDMAVDMAPRARYVEWRDKGWKDGFIFITMGGVGPAMTNSMTRTFALNGSTYVSTKRPDGWAQLIPNALASPDTQTYFQRAQLAVKALYDDATYIPLFGVTRPNVKSSSVHDDNWIANGNGFYFTPEKMWLDK